MKSEIYKETIESSNEKLKGVFQLLKESFEIYKSKIILFLGIIGPAVILIVLGTFVPLVGLESVMAFIIASLLLLTAIFVGLLSVLALLYAIKDDINVIDSYKRSFSKIKSFLWVSLLLFCLSKIWLFGGIFITFIYLLLLDKHRRLMTSYIGGIVLENGLLIAETIITFGVTFLLIIFGTLLFVKFFLSIYLFVFEKEKGIRAFSQSRQLVFGKFWKVLWRLLVFGFIFFIASFLFQFLLIIVGVDLSTIFIIHSIITWLILPFFLIYGMLIYKNLQEIKTVASEAFPRQRFEKVKRVAYAFIAILGLFLGLSNFVITANIIYRGNDISPVNDNDLRLPKVEIPKEDNAYYYFGKAMELVYMPRVEWAFFRAVVDGEKWDEAFVRNLLEKNEKVFYYFEKGIQLSYFQYPAFQDPEIVDAKTSIPIVVGIVDFARIKSIRAIYYFKQGEEERAFDKGIQIIRKGKMFQDSPRSHLIFYLVGSAVKEIGFETLRKMIPESKLSPEILKDYLVQLEGFRPSKQGLKNTFKMEYISTTNTMERFINIPLEHRTSFFYKPNQTHKWFAGNWRSAINNVGRDCWEIKRVEEDPKFFSLLHIHPLPKYHYLLKENIIGRKLFAVTALGTTGIIYRKCERSFSLEATRLLIAIRTYQLENGRIPESLDRLAPRFISEIPRDPFDGQFIRFSSKKRIVWSVGENFRDENGGGDDIVFNIGLFVYKMR